MAFTMVPEEVVLGCGITAQLALDPMPQKNAAGGYDLAGVDRTSERPSIQVSFVRDGSVVHVGPWSSVICGASSVVLDDGTVLDRVALDQLDSEGWEVLWKYGLIPTEFV